MNTPHTALEQRRLLLPLVFVMLNALSCAVIAPAPLPAPPPVQAAASADVASAADPEIDAVREHLFEHRERTGLTDREIAELAFTIVHEARSAELDPALVLAVMHVESRYNAFAVSNKDAMGLMQIVPATGEELAAELGIDWRGPHTLFDPIANVRIGIAYLRHLRARYDNLSIALAAYNWGPGRIDRRISRGAPLPTVYA
ncbi:MAG: lytic transglycosylase domain-containing protein, partial [Myxococcales bacterium]|nr:lytic transglycosylase domain-containing protein [Myxococcales bacterium]